MAVKARKSALVIGAGIVGVSSAYALQKAGFQTTLVDRVGPCAGASYGNAGAVVVDGCVPNAIPGLMRDVPSMLFDPTGPLTLRWSHLADGMPWLSRFVQETREEKVNHNAKYLKQISEHAVRDWARLMKMTKLEHLMTDVGWMKIYESDESFRGTWVTRKIMEEQNCPFEELNADEIRDLEPNLNPIFKHAIFQKKARFLVNPEKVVHGIADAFKHIGGTLEIMDVHNLKTDGDQVSAVGNTKTLKADKLILATGAWSKKLAGQLGDVVPLDAERGYHMMFPALDEGGISRPILNGEKSFVLAPMERGIRMTSQVELAGLERGPDFRRIRKLVPLAKRMLPTLNTQEDDVWLGHRPSLPDSLPVIGPSSENPNVIYAFGHQHYGMTLGPTTARLVREIVLGKKEPVTMWPYRANRF